MLISSQVSVNTLQRETAIQGNYRRPTQEGAGGRRETKIVFNKVFRLNSKKRWAIIGRVNRNHKVPLSEKVIIIGI